MSRIRSKDTKPERIVREFLSGLGIRYRLHSARLPGKPDLVFPRLKQAIFIHGCFWHGHAGCKFFVTPKTRTAWWIEKINKNQDRDKAVKKLLKKDGWRVLTVFECQLKPAKKQRTLQRILKFIDK